MKARNPKVEEGQTWGEKDLQDFCRGKDLICRVKKTVSNWGKQYYFNILKLSKYRFLLQTNKIDFAEKDA